jgi:hypothetical protein
MAANVERIQQQIQSELEKFKGFQKGKKLRYCYINLAKAL